MVRKLQEITYDDVGNSIQNSTQEYDILDFILDNKKLYAKMLFGVVLFGSVGLILLRIFVTLIVELCRL